MRTAGQQVGGVSQGREQGRGQADVVDVSTKPQNTVAVVEIGGVAVVETGECEVASHAPELDVVFALKTAKLGGISVVEHKAAESR